MSSIFKLALALAIAPAALAPAAFASEAAPALEPTIPVTIDLSEVEAREGPLYISIQKEDEYMGMRGHGGIIQAVTGNLSEVTYKVDVPGRYAVSLWHDLDDDAVFSMGEDYRIEDGWGGSGELSAAKRPTFDDVAVDVPAYGTSVNVKMFYPE